MTTEELLFKLIRCELWGEKPDCRLTTSELVSVMDLAHRQTVTGIVLNPISENAFGDEWDTVSRYISRLLKIQRKNTSVNHELADFARQCLAAHIDYVVVKGQLIGAFYPHPMLRMSGDIDFLIKDDYPTAKKQIERQLDVKLADSLLEKETAFKRNGILYELHTHLLTFGNSSIQAYWDKQIRLSWDAREHVTIDDVPIRTLPPTLNVVYVFGHLFHHFLKEGVGLRQLCDLAVLLHSQRSSIDRRQLSAILHGLDFTKAFRAFEAILTDKLGLPAEDLPLPLEPSDKKWVTPIVKDILIGGNFGKDNHKTRQTGWRFKTETLRMVLTNCFRYYPLAPSEIRWFVVKLLKINLRLLLNNSKKE